ncbi:Vms1/Ankzf1 family peptidyl-tRNA hydrolase [Halomarina ordinaria]|uniref:Vms1/Ankzf1 family peptidyl-tRNA hydrolase n=1 Tax=Halomarina ordinaria TaxID=3033939 RepID=A0ABD5U313_9EURY|nr:Vms1/Ankzf1 family peptidyl-tRNA hydrolase [Halomarina sp. PSRA2]
MLDRLLGRAALRDRIDDLEEERHHLERRLDAERERRREAATARQEAEERVNRLEDRLAGLEGELEAADAPDLAFRRRERLGRRRTEAVLSRLESVETGAEGGLSAAVHEGVPDPLADLLGERAALVSRAAPCLVYADDAGLVSVALSPPLLPDAFCTWDDRFRVEREWFLPVGRYALALVRADTFALGVYEGDERVDYRGFESDVKEQHSKGGFSQGRFERIRDGQIADHLNRCEDALDGVSDPLYVVGERTVLDRFEERAAVTRAVDATGDPEDALDDARRAFWRTHLMAV